MGKKTYKLKDVLLDEVSLVGMGDNPRANVLLLKAAKIRREDGQDFPAEAFAYTSDTDSPSTWELRLWDSPEEKETPVRVNKAVAALGPGVREEKAPIPGDDLPGVKSKLLSAWLKTHAGKSENDAPEIIKSKGGFKMPGEELKKLKGDFQSLQEKYEGLEKSFRAQGKVKDDLEAQVKELTKSAESEDDVTKGMSEEVRKAFEEQKAELQKQADVIAKMEDERITKVLVEKAKTDYPLAGDPEFFAGLVKSLDDSQAEKFHSAMSAVNERIKKGGLFKSIGHGDGEGGTALEKITALAKEYAKKSGCTQAEAFAHVYKTSDDLRKQYVKERN